MFLSRLQNHYSSSLEKYLLLCSTVSPLIFWFKSLSATCPFSVFLKVEDWRHKHNLMHLGIVLTRTLPPLELNH